MSNLNELRPIQALSPFKRFCCTIGNLPSSYVESMSYMELVYWLCDYLQNTVIPALNNNAYAIQELQNYFSNLDIQEEINNKLDQMAESGELTEIISQYLQLAGLLCFNTVNDMKNATNLINGSFVKTFGKINYNDGYGEFYKIRNVLNSDTIDEINIISLYNPLLIAELIPNDYVNQTQINNYLLKSNGIADHLGIGNDTYTSNSAWSSVVNSIRANRISTQNNNLVSAPSVFSPSNSKQTSQYKGRDSVASFIANQGILPRLSVENNVNIIYYENYVEFPNIYNLDNIKQGMVIDTLHENSLSALITSIDKTNSRIYIQDGWYYKGEKVTSPTNGIGFNVGLITKIWASNKAVTLFSELPQVDAVGEELDLISFLPNNVNKNLIGYDCVTTGIGNADIGFMARTGDRQFDSVNDIGTMERGFVAKDCTEGFETWSNNDKDYLLLSKNQNGQLTNNRFFVKNDGTMSNIKNESANITNDGNLPSPNIKIWYFIPSADLSYTLPDLTKSNNSAYNGRIYCFLNRTPYTVTLSNGKTIAPYSAKQFFADNVWMEL